MIYALYRGVKVPRWWLEYLPDEKNPYSHEDSLTFKKGYLDSYSHETGSCKHKNLRRLLASTYIREMIYKRFGGAFLTSTTKEIYRLHHHLEVKCYDEPEHITYRNARLEGDYIHVLDAHKYYEHVISLVHSILLMITKDHLPSPITYKAKTFFPEHTDAECVKAAADREALEKEWDLKRQQVEAEITSESYSLVDAELDPIIFCADSYLDGEGWSYHFPSVTIRSNLPYNLRLKMYTHIARLRENDKSLVVHYNVSIFEPWGVLQIASNKISAEVKTKIEDDIRSSIQHYTDSHLAEQNFFTVMHITEVLIKTNMTLET